jgi:xanthine dehydrogenase accessory factor
MEFSWKDLAEALKADTQVALCTIIKKRGSVPREIGARMLVRADASITGTVGGGIGEHEVIQAALACIKAGKSRLLDFSLAGEQGLDSAAICGGHFTLFIGCWTQSEDLELATAIAATLTGGKTHSLCESLPQTETAKLERTLFDPAGNKVISAPTTTTLPTPEATVNTGNNESIPVQLRQNAAAGFLLSEITLPPRMVIFGGGHLALPLVEMANWCRFAVTVIDDRPEFSNKERFPLADQVLTAPMEDVADLFIPGANTWLVLITREHKHDYILLKQLLGTEYAYLGMIGSRRRTTKVKQRLIDEGFAQAEIEKLYSPIGLEIKAQTPAEIAISIMAEIIQVKNAAA